MKYFKYWTDIAGPRASSKYEEYVGYYQFILIWVLYILSNKMTLGSHLEVKCNWKLTGLKIASSTVVETTNFFCAAERTMLQNHNKFTL